MKVLLIAILTAFVFAATPALAAGDAAKGKDLFLKKCKACHGEDGAGTAPMKKKYGEKLVPLADAKVQGKKDAELGKAIAAAAEHKAIAKTLQPADVDNVVAFIRALKK